MKSELANYHEVQPQVAEKTPEWGVAARTVLDAVRWSQRMGIYRSGGRLFQDDYEHPSRLGFIRTGDGKVVAVGAIRYAADNWRPFYEFNVKLPLPEVTVHVYGNSIIADEPTHRYQPVVSSIRFSEFSLDGAATVDVGLKSLHYGSTMKTWLIWRRRKQPPLEFVFDVRGRRLGDDSFDSTLSINPIDTANKFIPTAFLFHPNKTHRVAKVCLQSDLEHDAFASQRIAGAIPDILLGLNGWGHGGVSV